MMRAPLLLLAGLLVVGAPSPAAAQAAVSLSIDRSEATLADTIRLTVTVEGKRSVRKPPDVEGLENFTVSSGGTSSQVNVVNGQMTSSVDYLYYLTPGKAGTYVIGPARLMIDGTAFLSGEAKLTVVKAAAAAPGESEPLFLTAVVERDRLYTGEQTLYTLRLYRLVRVGDISVDLPEAGGLAFRQYGSPREFTGVFKGRSYDILEVRYILKPQRKGSHVLAPARMQMMVYKARRSSRRNFFGDQFFSAGRAKSLMSAPVELEVLDTPAEGRPADFSGLVGNFGMSATLDPPAVTVGESATLTVAVSGRGNVRRLPDLELASVEGLKMYADEPSLDESHDEKGTAGVKTMKWALVPGKAGSYVIPALTVSFFHTGQEAYRRISSPVLKLEAKAGDGPGLIVAGAGAGVRAPVSSSPTAVRELGRDILPVHTSVGDLVTSFHGIPASPALLMILAAPPAGFLLFVGGVRLRRKSASSMATLRSKRAARTFIRHVRSETSPEGMMKVFQEYLNDRFGLSLGALTPSEAGEILREGGVGAATAGAVADELSKLEGALYSGGAEAVPPAAGNLARLVRKAERELR